MQKNEHLKKTFFSVKNIYEPIFGILIKTINLITIFFIALIEKV